jgi:DNA end-binding protein Ku
MAVRSMASLTISFGLVAIPVKLHTATRSAATPHFHLVHKKDGSRLKEQYVCQKEGKVVGSDEIIKGYEFAKGRYVTFTSTEIKALEELGTHTIELEEFAPLASIDPVYFDRTYYLAPDKGGARPYALFVRALGESGRCAVGRWASHGRDHVVVLRALGSVLAMQQLHFASEVRPADELGVPTDSVREPELKLARQLIEQRTVERFDPTSYRDQVSERIEAAIKKKVEGEKFSVSEPRPTRSSDNVIDLAAALRASLERNSGGQSTSRRANGRRPGKRVAGKAAAS